ASTETIEDLADVVQRLESASALAQDLADYLAEHTPRVVTAALPEAGLDISLLGVLSLDGFKTAWISTVGGHYELAQNPLPADDHWADPLVKVEEHLNYIRGKSAESAQPFAQRTQALRQELAKLYALPRIERYAD